jgi:hypothetical protein
MRFWKDSFARIPFAVIGILLIILSITISAYFNHLEYQKAMDVIEASEINRLDRRIPFLVQELNSLLNYAGLRASDYAGNHPIVVWYNKSLFKNGNYTVRENYWRYLTYRYFEDMLESRFPLLWEEYTVDVRIGDWDGLSLERYNMTLDNASSVTVYYTVKIPATIIFIHHDQSTIEYPVFLETTVTSRLPFLEWRAEEYYESINDTGMLIMTTPMIWAIAWTKGYAQYFGKGISNVVSNSDIEKIVNLGVFVYQNQKLRAVDVDGIFELGKETGVDALKWGIKKFNRTRNMSAVIDLTELLFKSGNNPEMTSSMSEVTVNLSSIVDAVDLETMNRTVSEIIRGVYSADVSIEVKKHSYYLYSPHPGFEFPSGSTEWELLTSYLVEQSEGLYPDIYKEKWKLIYTRESYYWNKNGDIASFTDRKITEVVVNFRIIRYSESLGFYDDIARPFIPHRGDRNLADIVDKIKNQLYDPNKESMLYGNLSHVYGNVVCDYDPVLRKEILKELNEIKASMKKSLNLTGKIDFREYSHPEKLIVEMRSISLQEFNSNREDWLSSDRYRDGNGQFNSAKDKAMYLSKKWFIDYVGKKMEETYNKGLEDTRATMKGQLSSVPLIEKVVEGWEKGKEYLTKEITIYSTGGFELTRLKGNRTLFNESVVLEIYQEPSYLKGGAVTRINVNGTEKKLYLLSIRNVCVFPSLTSLHGGLRILPPPEPWLITLNIWIIQVKGHYLSSTIADITNIGIPGDEGYYPLKYTRQFEVVKDPFNGELIGENRPPSFNFTTAIVVVVPPGIQGIGDMMSGMTEANGEFREFNLNDSLPY